MEKPIYETDKHIKNGFHLAFPNLFLKRENLLNLYFQRFLTKLKKSELELDPMNKYTTPWLMYGGTKNETSKPYKLTKIYDVDFNEMTLSTLTNFKIFDTDENQIEIDKEKIESFLPRIFSINPGHREITEINKNKCKEPLIVIEEKNNFKNHTNETILTENEIKENIRKIRILLPMINCDNGKKDNSFCKWSTLLEIVLIFLIWMMTFLTRWMNGVKVMIHTKVKILVKKTKKSFIMIQITQFVILEF